MNAIGITFVEKGAEPPFDTKARRSKRVIEIGNTTIDIAVVEGGTTSGAPAVALVAEDGKGNLVIMSTTWTALKTSLTGIEAGLSERGWH